MKIQQIKLNSILLLGVIVLLGLFLRLYNLDSNPQILNRDEAALAYNAYLLQETGRDEWGRSWPLALESFGDFKLLGYPLLLLISYRFWGLSDLAVRLPSALAGVGLIILAYGLARQLKQKKAIATLVAFSVAVSPVFTFYSRMAFEANVGLLYLVSLLWLIFEQRGVEKKRWALPCSLLLALLGVFTYNTPLLLLPFIILIIPMINSLKKVKLWLPLVVGLGIVGAIGVYILLPLSTQKSGITIFNDESTWMRSVEYRQQYSGVWQRTLGNKYVFYSQIVIKNVLQSFSPQFLVTKGGSHPWHRMPGFGHMSWTIYLAGLVGILVALWQLTRRWLFRQKASSLQLVSIYLLLIALIPSVITVDAPHATRSLLFIFWFHLFAGQGWYYLALVLMTTYRKLRKDFKLPGLLKQRYIWIVVTVFLSIEAIFYFNHYFTTYLSQQQMLLPGFQTIIRQVEEESPTKKVAVVDDSGFQYILTAWYLKITPQEFFTTIIKQQPDQIGFKYGEQLTHYHFIADDDDRSESEEVLINWTGREWQEQQF